MPSVYLDDNEVIDLIIERPHLIQAAFERLHAKLEEEESLSCNAINLTNKLRKRIKDLENNG